MKLSEARNGIPYKITQLPNDQESQLTLRSLGILVGDEIQIIGRAPFNGPLAIKHLNNTFLALRLEIAQKITIQ